MTGEWVVNEVQIQEVSDRTKYVVDWVSITGGTAVSMNINMVGFLVEVETIPGQNGVPATDPPDSLYDITITDPYGYDLMGGKLADRSNTVAERKLAANPMWVDDYVVINISGAGDANQGRIIIWVDRNLNE
jgi:hypothetical protein